MKEAIQLKKMLGTFLVILLLILTTPLILGCILILYIIQFCLYPFRYANYKNSPFYHDFNLKFDTDYYCTDWYEFYNVIRTNDFPIRCIPRYDDKGKLFWMNFTYGEKLLSFLFPECTYDHEQNTFIILDVSDDDMEVRISLDQYTDELLTEWNRTHPTEEQCSDIVFFVTEKDDFESLTDIAKAKEIHNFYFYNSKNIATALEKFISQQ